MTKTKDAENRLVVAMPLRPSVRKGPLPLRPRYDLTDLGKVVSFRKDGCRRRVASLESNNTADNLLCFELFLSGFEMGSECIVAPLLVCLAM